jgi:hypothetical protein
VVGAQEAQALRSPRPSILDVAELRLGSKGLCGLDLDLPEHPLEPLLNDWIRSIVTLRGLRISAESKH